MNQDPILLKLVSEAGLQEKEAKVYLALLEIGQATVGDIAAIADLKRPIIYVLLDDLTKRGYATELPGRKIRTFQATDPGAISSQLQMTAKNFSQMLPILKTLSHQGGRKPKISFYDNPAGIQKIFDETNRAKSAIFIASIARLDYFFPGSVDKWQKGYANGTIKLASRTLIPNNQEDIQIIKKFSQITRLVDFRILSSMESCDMDICVFNDKMTITAFDKQPFMVVIESQSVPGFFLPIFDILWASSKKLA